MIQDIEILQINSNQLGEYLNKGYEFVCALVDSDIRYESISEEVPTPLIATQDSQGNYYSHQPIYVRKQYPVTEIRTRLLVKRTTAAKLLYEKSLKNETK